MTRITHVCRSGWPAVGGLEAAVQGLACHQASRGHDVQVVTLDRGPMGARLHACTADGVRWTRLRGVGPRRYRAARGLRAAVRGYDIVHVHGLGPLADQLAAMRGRPPFGISTHGGFGHTRRDRWLKAVWLRSGVRATLHACDAVWFTSRSDRLLLAPAGRTGSVVPNGVDVPAAPVREPVPGRWLSLGRVAPHKRIGTLIDLLPSVEAELSVVGPQPDPALVSALRDRARRRGVSGRVHFVGPVPRSALATWLQTAELAWFPSRFEGFGIAVVEAMGAGVPVVVSPIPAHLELVTDGVTGFVLDPAAPCALERLAAIRAANHTELTARARARAQQFSWSQVVEQFDGAYAALRVA